MLRSYNRPGGYSPSFTVVLGRDGQPISAEIKAEPMSITIKAELSWFQWVIKLIKGFFARLLAKIKGVFNG